MYNEDVNHAMNYESNNKLSALRTNMISAVRTHSTRVGICCLEMVGNMDDRSIFGIYDESKLNSAILAGGAYHDIGKAMLSQYCINSDADSVTVDEVLTFHPRHAAELIEGIDEGYFDSKAEKQIVLDMASCHHEKYDGTGYPYGLSGEAIPPAAKICALANMYDNLVRIEKKDYDEAKNTIFSLKGEYFGSMELDLFDKAYERIKNLYFSSNKQD